MPKKPPSTARLEAFSDGVIAVIITIMVLELKVPQTNGLEALHAIVPILLIYLLSFTFTGIYWTNHHHLIERVDSSDPVTLYANLIFLFCLSLLPFSTSYVLAKNMNSFAVCFYAVSMIACGFSFLLLRLAVHRSLRRAGSLKREDVSAQRKHLASLALYVVVVPLAFFHSRAALLIIALITVVWIVPNMALSKHG